MKRNSVSSSFCDLRPLNRELLAGAAVVALMLGQAANANPAGHTVASGTATFTTPSTGTLQIKQTSSVVIINWSSFNIAASETTKFVQPTTSSIAVNRIGGSSPSQILGSLLANGKVVLINANGILFGPSSKVNVGSLIATASDAANASLATGKATFSTAGKPNAQIINQGTITAASGGMVGLIAPAVSNTGTITAKLGTVTLGASNIFTLDFTGDGLVSFPVTGNVTAVAVKNNVPVTALVVDSGQITGGTVMLTARAAASLVTNVISMGGTVTATSASQVGGKIVLDGGSSGNIAVSGKLIADGTSGGSVSVTSPGTNTISGTITAKNTSTTGKGGAITTKGKTLTVTGGVNAGKGGSWLFDSNTVTVNAKTASVVDAALTAGTNTTLQSETGTTGDITVASSMSWSGTGSLTLNAYRNLVVNNGIAISNSGSGSLALAADHGAKDMGTVTFTGTGKANWSASTGGVNVFYHPSSYASPTSFSSHVTLHSGSKLTSYMTVDTATDLQNVNSNLKGVYALNANIGATSLTSFVPIGLDSYGSVANSSNGFTGVFDGQNHTIDKLKITTTSASTFAYTGLFGYVGAGGIVRNVGLTNVTINDTGSGHIIGALVGKNMGTVSNSYSTGSAKSAGSFIGGLVGSNRGTITSSHSSVTVTDNDSAGAGFLYLGGLVEYNAGTISNSYASGAVSEANSGSADDDVGGLVGWNDGGNISGSHATGTVTANGDFNDVGGLAGRSGYTGTSTISSSYASGNVSGGGYMANVGGLVGAVTQISSITGSHATGNVTGSGHYAFVGGLVGDVTDTGTISSSYATGSVTGGPDSYDGGLVGSDLIGTVTGSTASGAVNGGTGSCTGALIGYPNTNQAGCE